MTTISNDVRREKPPIRRGVRRHQTAEW